MEESVDVGVLVRPIGSRVPARLSNQSRQNCPYVVPSSAKLGTRA